MPDPKISARQPGNNKNAIGAVIGATVGAGVALVGLPVCIGALGFTGAGIAAGSVAAKMMSAAAIANGGGVAAGSAVAVLQSIGAAGLSLGAKVGLTSVLSSAGAASGAWLSKLKKHPRDKPKNDKNPVWGTGFIAPFTMDLQSTLWKSAFKCPTEVLGVCHGSVAPTAPTTEPQLHPISLKGHPNPPKHQPENSPAIEGLWV
ncbi:interferon alpha-inducible protein 27-like protein 2B [Lonchura striata]